MILVISLDFSTKLTLECTGSELRPTFWLGGGFVLLHPAYAQTELESDRDGRGLQFHPVNFPTEFT